jgi:hypothetical protein
LSSCSRMREQLPYVKSRIAVLTGKQTALLQSVSVRPGDVINTLGSLYSVIVVNLPRLTRHLRSGPQENNTRTKINGNTHSRHLASADHGFGCVQVFLVCIQVHPSAWLLKDQVYNGLDGGGAHDSAKHDSTQGRAEQRSTVHQHPLSSTYEHNCTF